MKKFLLIMCIVLFAYTSNAQLLIKQIAFGAKGIDSVVGGAPAGGTAKYYYFNLKETTAAAKVVSTTPITNYQIYAIQVTVAVPTKAADVVDSCQITFEISYDNTNWFKWSNGGATSTTTQTQYEQGGPKVTGSGVYTYLVSARDMVTTTTTAGGALFFPKGCYAPYSRVKITSFKASSSAYAKIFYTLKPIN